MGEQIKNLEELLTQYLVPNKKVISFNIDNLLAPGENYLSVVLKIDVTLYDEENRKEEKLNVIAKCLQSTNIHEVMKMFRMVGYKNERNWYVEILPILQNFVEEMSFKGNFDFFPKLIAYRNNLHGKTDDVDDDSILMLDNLVVNGYSNIDRHVGFDYDGAKFILKDLATFHAVPLALKLKKPKLFEEKIRNILERESFKPAEPKEGGEPQKPLDMGFDVWLDVLQSHSQCISYLSKLRKLFDFVIDNPDVAWGNYEKREPFATITHNDLWVNNTMQVIKDSRILKNKIVDYQTCRYDSPACDLLFFIWSSVQTNVINNSFQDLIEYYHKNFLEVLVELECDRSTFSFEKFTEELKFAAKFEILHLLYMVEPIFAEKGKFARDMTENPVEIQIKKEEISFKMSERIAIAVEICGREGWI